jgi:hypothetical protein
MTDETPTTLRRCIGSARFGIAPHEAPHEAFPRQPSQHDGLGRMCRTHWNAYTAGLSRDAKARRAAVEGGDLAVPAVDDPDAAPVAQQPASEPKSAGKRHRRSTAHAAGVPPAAAG